MTIEQKQCLLYYLGYYTGKIDGVWGNQSKQATKEFQSSYGLTADGVFGSTTEKKILSVIYNGTKPTVVKKPTSGNWWDDIKYFNRDEFKCKCGGRYCNGYPAEMSEKVVRLADGAREYFDYPATVISGLRCKTHNANEGGVYNSRHMSGKAIDLRVNGISADTLLSYIKKQPGVRYAYKINSTNVHFDVD